MAFGVPLNGTDFDGSCEPEAASGLSRLPTATSEAASRKATSASGAAPPFLAMSDFTARSKIMSPTAETVIVAGPEGCVGSNEGVGVADGVGTAVVVTEGLDEAVCVGCAAEARSARTPTATA